MSVSPDSQSAGPPPADLPLADPQVPPLTSLATLPEDGAIEEWGAGAAPMEGVGTTWPVWEGVRRSFPVAPAPAEAPRREFWLGAVRATRLPLFVLLLYTALFNLSVVRGNSMAPGIHDGDRILVEPWSYLFGTADRGDVVVMRYPLDPTVDYIKRVVGMPGDQVVIRGGRVWINDVLLDEPYVAFSDPHSVVQTVVEEGHYFVLGDNRPRSSDSRDFGQVPESYLRGRVDVRLWPPTRLGWID